MANQLINYQSNGVEIALSPQIVRDTLTKGQQVSDSEVAMFIEMAKAQQLNPFLNEIYLIKYGTAPATFVVSKDAFMKRAEKNDSYDGFEAGIYVVTKDGILQERKGTIVLQGETIVGGWAKVYRKDIRLPYESTVNFSDYNTGKSMWSKMPSTMIRKVAIVSAMREAFPNAVGGLYTNDEMDQEEPKQAQLIYINQNQVKELKHDCIDLASMLDKPFRVIEKKLSDRMNIDNIDSIEQNRFDEAKHIIQEFYKAIAEAEAKEAKQVEPATEEKQPDLFQTSEPIADEDLPFTV